MGAKKKENYTGYLPKTREAIPVKDIDSLKKNIEKALKKELKKKKELTEELEKQRKEKEENIAP